MSRERRIAFWLGGLIAFLGLVWLLDTVLMPFVAGMLIAYMLDPLADRLERLGCSRLLATVLITAGFFVAVAVVLVVTLPLLHGQIVGFLARLPGLVEALRGQIEQVLASLSPEDLQKLRGAAQSYSGNAVQWVGGVLRGVLTQGLAVVDLLSVLVITPLMTFYLIRDWDHLVARVDDLLPRCAAPTIREQVRAIDRTLAGFVRGQATVCAVLGVFYGIGLTAVGLEFGLVVGLGAGLISFIPFVGSVTGVVVGIGMALAQGGGWPLAGFTAAVFAVGQMLEGNLLTPKLVGDRVGLHPVWVVFALLAGGSLFGFTGVLLAVPVAAAAGVLIRFAIARYRESELYLGEDDISPPGVDDGPPSTPAAEA